MNHTHFSSKTIRLALLALVLVLGLLLAPFNGRSAHAADVTNTRIDPALLDELASVPGSTPLEVVIVFNDTAAASQIQTLSSTFHQLQVLPMAGAILTADQINSILDWPEIASITLNVELDYFLAESTAYVGATQVWQNYGERGGNAVVAVLDSGIDGTHADLAFGQNVIQNVKLVPYGPAVENVPLTDTSSGHGTHVASTIAGTGAVSGGYYQGMAPEAKLVGLGAGEAISILTAVEGYDWILANHDQYNIRVVNNSWGSSGGDVNLSNPINIATLAAYKEGIVSVFAAGNDGGYDIMNPYSIVPWVIGVAAGDKSGELAGFSSRGKDGDYFKHPDLTAPGVDIYAARSSTLGITVLDPDPNPVNPAWTLDYTKMSGTSMATPHISGAVALLLSANSNLSPDQVMDLLIDNTDPMAGYLLHEVGSGYLNMLASYQASLNVTGNLSDFLAGDWQHGEEEVLGFDPDYAPVYDEYLYSGFTPVGASGLPASHDHPFEVGDDIMYVNIDLTWEPQAEDAYDMEVLDPTGALVASSGNSVNEGENVFFVPDMTGTYTLRINPFAAAGTQYQALVKLAYGNANPPANSDPTYDYYLGITNVYRDTGVVGLAAEYYKHDETGFVSFTLNDSNGATAVGQSGPLQVIYTDGDGNVITVDDNPNDRGAGEYSSSFDFNEAAWTDVYGQVNIQFARTDGSTLRAPSATIWVGHLDVTFNTDATNYNPGDVITFDGTVAQMYTIGLNNVELTPQGGATVSIKLVDADGNRLVSTQALTNSDGEYNGTITAPQVSRGPATLLVEADYEESNPVTGTAVWHGETEGEVIFPGNLAPTAELHADTVSERNRTYVHLQATAVDPDGADDISNISLVLTDGDGLTIKRWKLNQFETTDDDSLSLVTGRRLRGDAPWTLSLTVTDSAGQSVVTSAVLSGQ